MEMIFENNQKLFGLDIFNINKDATYFNYCIILISLQTHHNDIKKNMQNIAIQFFLNYHHIMLGKKSFNTFSMLVCKWHCLANPYITVTGCLLSVVCTEGSHSRWNQYGGGYHHPSKKNRP